MDFKPVPQHTVQPALGEAPLDAVYAGIGHVQGWGHLGSGQAPGGHKQYLARDATRAGLLSALTS